MNTVASIVAVRFGPVTQSVNLGAGPVAGPRVARLLHPKPGPPAAFTTMITTPSNNSSFPQGRYTLDPLATLGADALCSDLALGIKGVFLQELGIGWDNVFQEIVVRRSSDVFGCAAAAGSWHDTLPPGARLVCAVLRFHLTGAGQPYFAEIWPPHILTLSPAYAAEPMNCWLAAHGFALKG
ncbi:MAG: hypothetical protein NT154_26405 [Verrucomicrobia bacterium]|nr:hypothetical protein [Verrucomicrobiota bacterium]